MQKRLGRTSMERSGKEGEGEACSPPPYFPPPVYIADEMVEAPAAVLAHEVILRMSTMCLEVGEEKRKEPGSLGTMELLC